jgi:hypothetical protein
MDFLKTIAELAFIAAAIYWFFDDIRRKNEADQRRETAATAAAPAPAPVAQPAPVAAVQPAVAVPTPPVLPAAPAAPAAPAPVALAAPAPAAPPVPTGLTPEVLALITAAVHVTLGASARIVSISTGDDAMVWAAEGRRRIYATRNPR